jgi:hypothetical protein
LSCWRRCLLVEVAKGKLSEGWKSLCGEVGRPLRSGLLLLAVAVAVLRWRGSGWKNGWWELCCGVLEAVVVIRSRAGVASCIPGSLAATKTGGARSAGSAALGPARSAANHVRPNHIVPFCSLQGYYIHFHPLHSSLFLASCHYCEISTDRMRSSLLTRRDF